MMPTQPNLFQRGEGTDEGALNLSEVKPNAS